MVISSVFTGLARMRRAPAFHPRGVLHAARLVITDAESGLAVALGGATTGTDALVRLSKGIGTPTGWPDLLGFAMRVLRPHGGPLDVLLTTTGRRGPAGLLLSPSRGWLRNPYSTLLPYQVPRGRTVLRAVAENPGCPLGTGYDELVAATAESPVWFTLLEGHRPVAGVALLREVAGDIAFDPVLHVDAAMRPAVLTAIRAMAYRGSRAGRGAAGLERVPGRPRGPLSP